MLPAMALAVPLLAQTEMPAGIFRGAMMTWQGSAAASDLTIRDAQGTDLVCHLDAHSYVEREHRRIGFGSLTQGERLEILADHKPGSRACYARTVQVIDPAAERARLARKAVSPVRSLIFTPTGDRTLAGMVLRLTSRVLTLRTRNGDTTLTLRPDTRYWDDGVRTDSAALRVNTRVFVRAGRTIEGIVEAYQVMWGQILDVAPGP